MMLILAISLDFDVNVWLPPDERVGVLRTDMAFMPLQFRKGTSSTGRKLLLRFVAREHFVLLKPDPPGAAVRPGQAANEYHYLNGNRDVATGLYVPHAVFMQACNISCEARIAAWCNCKQYR